MSFTIPKDIANEDKIMNIFFKINNPVSPASLYEGNMDTRMLGLGLIGYTISYESREKD
jgi:hypothetical protein